MVLRIAAFASAILLCTGLVACSGARLRSPRAAIPRAPAPGALYFVLVDRFENGDPKNDGDAAPDDPKAWHGGDVVGLRQRLSWLQELGVETVWTSPLTLGRREAFLGHGAYHGYWVLDHRLPDRHLGSFAEIRALSDALHARGMRLILDAVLNHVAYEAPLTREHPAWFHHRGAIEDWDDPLQMVEGEVHGLPDLAVEKPAVFAYLVGALEDWIARVHPDGLRLDAVKHLPLTFWKRLTARLHQKYGPGFSLLGEDLEGDPLALAARWAATGFDSVFDFPLRYALVDVACKGAPASRLAAILSLDRVYAHPERLTTLLDNHDLPRIATECQGRPKDLGLALSLLYSLRGTPSILYGTEVGLEGKTDDLVRQQMRFDEDHPLRQVIPELAAIRRAHPALTGGQTRVLGLEDDLLILQRLAPATTCEGGSGSPAGNADEGFDAVVVAVNLGPARSRVIEGLGPEPKFLGARQVTVIPLALGPEARAALRARIDRDGSLERPRMIAQSFEVTVPKPLAAGERLLLVGSDPALGGWKPARAPELEAAKESLPGGGRVFRASVVLPVPSVIAWKLVRAREGSWRWQDGANRVLDLREATATTHRVHW